MSYHDQKKEGDAASKEFCETCMLVFFLHHFNKVVEKNGGAEKPIAGGTGVTFADFALFHVLDATISQFNTEFYGMAWGNLTLPLLKTYHSWIKNRPNLKVYFQTDRCPCE